jgi:hypothetical protein
MPGYNSLCDDYYVNLNLSTEMELPSNRDTVLHFFEQLKKKYPVMRNFYGRERGEYVLEEDKHSGNYRWATVEQKRVSSGYVNPPTFDDAIAQHLDVLESVPHSLSISPLDCEAISLMYGFDFNYRGNQHELLAETFGMLPMLEKMRDTTNGKLLAFEPTIQLALDDDCRTQCRLSIDSRTTAFQIRTGEFPEEQLSVYLTVRRYGSLDTAEDYATTFKKLIEAGENLMQSHVVENVLLPLRQAIAIK